MVPTSSWGVLAGESLGAHPSTALVQGLCPALCPPNPSLVFGAMKEINKYSGTQTHLFILFIYIQISDSFLY